MKELFDLSFTRFVAPSVARIVYIVLVVVVALSYLIAVIAAFRTGLAYGLFVLVIIGPLFAVFYLVLARVGLESLIATIRTAENTAELVRLQGGNYPTPQQGTPPNYPPAPQDLPPAPPQF